MCGIISNMINTINSDLIRGHIDTIILSVLHEGDRYGYDILGEIEKKSDGKYILKQPTLYSCLKRLESQGFIYKYWGTETAGGRRTYYSLTEMGKELFLKNKDEWKFSRGVIDKLISTSDDVIDADTLYVAVPADTVSSPVTETDEQSPDKAEHSDPALSEVEAESEPETVAESDDVEVKKDEEADDEFTIEQAYAEVLAEAEKTEIKRAMDSDNAVSEFGSPAYESYYNGYTAGNTSNTEAYSYADRLSHETVKVVSDNDEDDYASSYFAKDISSETDEDENESEDYYSDEEESSDDECSGDEDSEYDETDEDAYIDYSRTATDKPLYTDDDFNEDPVEQAEPAHEPTRDNVTFRSYESAELSDEATREMIIEREYRNVIRQLLSGDIDAETYYEDMIARAEASIKDDEVAATDNQKLDIVEEDKLVGSEVSGDANNFEPSPIASEPPRDDFDNLMLSVRSMGDDIRIRTYNGSIEKEYNSLYHYYSNKLMLFKYGIMFAIMILEIIIPYFIIKLGLGINIVAELPVLVISVVFAALFPIYSISAYLIDPFKQKRYDFELKTSLICRLGIMVLMLVLVYAANVVFYMDISFEAEYAFSLITPALLTTNIPLAAVVFKQLYDTGKFAAND